MDWDSAGEDVVAPWSDKSGVRMRQARRDERWGCLSAVVCGGDKRGM